ncbi:MAG TPA: alpha-glucosidase [Spirochaetota bacterium]|nr:alpha-glucosidase [Spirochaetota bacterium]
MNTIIAMGTILFVILAILFIIIILLQFDKSRGMGILGRYRNTASCLSTADITITITMVMVAFVMLGSPGLSTFELHSAYSYEKDALQQEKTGAVIAQKGKALQQVQPDGSQIDDNSMLKVEHDESSFLVYYKNRCILKHSANNPCIAVGNGTAEYAMSKGSFKIKEKIANKINLKKFTIKENSDTITINFDDTVTIAINAKDNCTISFQCKPDYNRLWLKLEAYKKEHIYGCGEQFSKLDLKNKTIPLWVEEQGVGRGHDLITFLATISHGAGGAWNTTYYPQPTFVSSNNYFVHCNISSYAQFSFNDTNHCLYFWQIPVSIVIGYYDSAVECIKAVGDLVGRQPRLPAWVHDGMWLGVQGGTEVVQSKLQDALDSGVRVSAVWVQDWVGKRITWFGKQLFWNWRYSHELYPDLPALIKELSHKNIKFLGYINCFLTTDGDLYKEASQKGYLVKDKTGAVRHIVTTAFPAGVIDLTNPHACRWIKDVIKKNMIDLGLNGWMADFGEYLETDTQLYSGESAELFHNTYSVQWAKVNYEAIKEAGKLGDIVFFTRAGYTGTSQYSPLIWAGDQLVNWSKNDGLASVIPAGISLGFCGVGYYHSDIGGYTTLLWIKRSKELFMRWAELSAFTPVMRTHEGNRPESNWQFNSDKETLQHLAKMTRIHTALKPYFEKCKDEYHTNGLPLIRHPYIHYPDDEKLHLFQYQYLLGRDLLVAPVYRKGKKKWEVYLPHDNWIHVWSGKEFSGGTVKIDAPLGQPPVFYRKDSKLSDLFMKLKDI